MAVDVRTDRELLVAYARRDESAFVVFFHRHRRAIAGRLGQQLAVEADVEEALQEVFLVAATKWRRIAFVEGSARNWLLGVARNVLSERLRAASRRPIETRLEARAPTMPASASEADLDWIVELRMVEKAVARMQPVDQQIYRLGFVEGRTDVDTARILELKPANVRKRSQRIRQQLRPIRGDAG